MLPSWVHSQRSSALPEHCQPSSPVLAKVSSALHVCLPTPLALLSSTLGALSIVSWLFAQLPQIYKNFTLQSTAGLSVWFLVEWCLGDSANLIGAVLTDQAGWQVTIAAYYVFVDVVLVMQYFWYTYLKPGGLAAHSYTSTVIESSGDDGGEEDHQQDVVAAKTHMPEPALPRLMPSSELKVAPAPSSQPAGTVQSDSWTDANEKSSLPGRAVPRAGPSGAGVILPSPRAILFMSMLCAAVAHASTPTTGDANLENAEVSHESWGKVAGRVSSWVSTVMYLASRMPQIYKNYRRKSTSGLSPLLFCAAFCGNLFYSLSLVFNPNAWFDLPPYGGGGWAGPHGNDRLEWIGRAIPFFIGAAGVLTLDGAVGAQFLMYAKKRGEVVIKVEQPSPGQRRWGGVADRMRGWLPFVSPVKSIPEEETQTLLSHMQDSYGSV
ncbi:hypothetical protein VTO42DRAFT_1142 [Malbranchea cinnamomea]